MRKGLKEQFNQEVDGYRKALVYHAKTGDWETFKQKAGRMFDYVEAIEYAELERRFFTNFNVILVLLVAVIFALFKVDFTVTPDLLRLKYTMVLLGLGGSSFQLYFYINYKIYIKVKTVKYPERREQFVRNMEDDFRTYLLQSERKAA